LRKEIERKHVAYPHVHQKVLRFFHLVKPEDVDQNAIWDCKNIVGFRALHSMTSISPRDITLLKLWNLICLCLECMDDNLKFVKTNPMFCLGHCRPLNLQIFYKCNLSSKVPFFTTLSIIYIFVEL
jgi:hypothetical protein